MEVFIIKYIEFYTEFLLTKKFTSFKLLAIVYISSLFDYTYFKSHSKIIVSHSKMILFSNS